MVAGDLSCHIGSTRDGFEDVIGCFSSRIRHQETEHMLGLLRALPENYKLILSKEAGASHHIQEWAGVMKVRLIMCCVGDTKI